MAAPNAYRGRHPRPASCWAVACSGSGPSSAAPAGHRPRAVSGRPVSSRLLPLHALPRGAELPRPPQQRTGPQGRPAATRGQQLPAPGGPEILPAPVPGQRRGARRLAPTMRGNRRLSTGHGAPGDEQHAGVFPVHARSRGAELARPHTRFRGAPWFQSSPIHGTDWNSPQIQNKIYECEHVMPAGGGVPAIYPGGPAEQRNPGGTADGARVAAYPPAAVRKSAAGPSRTVPEMADMAQEAISAFDNCQAHAPSYVGDSARGPPTRMETICDGSFGVAGPTVPAAAEQATARAAARAPRRRRPPRRQAAARSRRIRPA